MSRGTNRYLLANRERVARVIRIGLRRYGGSQSRAARYVEGVQRGRGERQNVAGLRRAVVALQRTLSRLLAQELSAITKATLADLRTLLSPNLYDELRLSMIPREGQQALWQEQCWMDSWLERVPPTAMSRQEWEQFGGPAQRPRDVSALERARRSRPLASQEEGRRLVEALRRAFPDVFKPFETWCLKRGHSQNRIHVAYARTVEPLLASHETAGIERGWREFEDQHLKRYLDVGLAREQMLLTRAPDSQRAAVL
jgi:hypothetical protein